MTTTMTRRSIRVDRARNGVHPATWGQQSMFDVINWMAPDTHYHNIVQLVPLDGALELDAVLDVVGAVVSRHESLRTRYHHGPDGRLLQNLDPRCDLEVEVSEAEPSVADDALEALLDDFAGHTFDLGADWPIRFAVGIVSGRPAVLVFVVSHQAADYLSARRLKHELEEALAEQAAGRPVPRTARYRQPVEQAAFERSARGLAINGKSQEYWRRHLESVPRALFSVDPGPARPVRFWRGGMESLATGLAAGVLAVRHRTSTSTVLLAATALALGTVTDSEETCPIQLMISNRFPSEVRSYVGNISQTVLTAVDLRGPRFSDVLRSAWSATTAAYKHGAYDTLELTRLRAEVAHRRGVELDLSTFFNDLRDDIRPARDGAATAESIRAAAGQSRFRWVQEWHRENMKFFLRLTDQGETVILSALADTAYLPPEVIRAVMEGIERILVAAATTDADVDQLRAASGIVGPLRTGREVLVDGCPTDPEAVRALLVDAVPGAAVGVELRPHPHHGHEIVGYLAGGQDVTPVSVHAACMALLVDRGSAAAPHRYVVTARPPADLADVAAWAALPVLATGDGR